MALLEITRRSVTKRISPSELSPMSKLFRALALEMDFPHGDLARFLGESHGENFLVASNEGDVADPKQVAFLFPI